MECLKKFDIKKTFFLIILFLLFSPILNVNADGLNTESKVDKINTDIINTDIINDSNNEVNQTQNSNDIYNDPNVGLPKVDIEQANSWVTRKGAEIIGFLQNAGSPIAGAFFIISMFIAIFGIVSKKGLSIGLIGMFVSAIAYTGILFAPQILNFFSGWVAG